MKFGNGWKALGNFRLVATGGSAQSFLHGRLCVGAEAKYLRETAPEPEAYSTCIMSAVTERPVEVLLVEDTRSDVELTKAAFEQAKLANRLSVVGDGQQALQYLRREGRYTKAPRPDLILLDLKLPIMDGYKVLAAIKSDADLATIPVVVLTNSPSELDVLKSYNLHANCYITKPLGFAQFVQVIREIGAFWFSIVILPRRTPPPNSA
jgi:CheY-like chemotaxis protein